MFQSFYEYVHTGALQLPGNLMEYLRYSLITTTGVQDLVKQGGGEFRFVLWSDDLEWVFVAKNLEGVEQVLVSQQRIALRIFKSADSAISTWRKLFPEDDFVHLPIKFDPDFDYGLSGPASRAFTTGKPMVLRHGS